jgi:prepilin-type N-terminal cleavage/methylation domain-containing protein
MLKLQRKIQAGFTIIELLIVIAIIGILATLVLTNFQGAQAKGRDSVRQNDINSIYQKLEEFYNENGGYPDGALSTTIFPGMDAEALKDADGTAITYTGGFITSTTAPTLTPTNTGEYIYAAYGCTTAGAQDPVGFSCTKYVLATFLEKGTGKYEKVSLN